MSRYQIQFLRGVVATVSLALLTACGSGENEDRPRQAAVKPVDNVILICIDAVRWDTWWVPERAGFEDEFTSRGQQALVMSSAVSTAPWTVPAVGSVLTGLYPSQHGGGLFKPEVANLAKQVPSALIPGLPTLPAILNEQGVRTLGVSSHPWFQASYGFEQGFDHLGLRAKTERVTGHGFEVLDSVDTASERFFLYLHYMEAHDRHLDLKQSRQQAADLDPGRRQDLLDTAPEAACDDPDSDICARYLTYAETVLKLRREIADILRELDDRGLLDSTLVMVYSDHGEEFHDHLQVEVERNVDPRGIYGFGHGQSLYQELLHVPLLVWHPQYGGRNVDEAVSLVDLLPGIIDWMGLDLPTEIQYPGKSLAGPVDRAASAAFTASDFGQRWPGNSERNLFASGIAYGPQQMAVIEGPTKLIWHQIDNSREFYNLQTDPMELNPDASSMPDKQAARLDDALDRYFGWYDSREFLPPELTDEVIEKLKGVGYLQGVESDSSDAEERETEDNGNP